MPSDNNSGNASHINKLPALWGQEFVIDGNAARQLIVPSTDYEIIDENGNAFIQAATGKWRLLDPGTTYEEDSPALRLSASYVSGATLNLGDATWVGNHAITEPPQVLASLKDAFTFLREDQETGRKGLRLPQIGAVHAVLGYWTTPSVQPATVVMPTGTGKTETMLSLFAAERLPRLIVVVPSDALRKQLAKKFESLGVLQDFGVIGSDAMRPVVGRIEHAFTNEVNARGFAAACNVIITTPNALMESPPEVWKALLKECSHLFIDEAHHIAASTWRQIRDEFAAKKVVQFTATPFREDGATLGGRMLYTFPLKEAQKQGYFSKINYISVVDFDDPDTAIAQKAIEVLRQDLANNLDHLVMARARSIKRAKELVVLYQELAPDLNPVILYSQLKQGQRRAALEALDSRESKIVVCVDMLGEGFDLPSLKVAAIHDAHKSLGVTLQFVGRFARVGDPSIGQATAIVNRGDPHHDKRLKELYAEDADWNYIIQDLSASAVGEQEEMSQFSEGFGNSLPEEVSLQNIAPKMSTVVYKTQTTAWHPERLVDHFKERLFTVPLPVNHQEHVAWLVTKEIAPVRWGDVKSLEDTTYNLYIFYWDSTHQMLYINSSSNDGMYEDLAKLVCGDSIERCRGTAVYKTMATINRRIPTNVGLLDIMNRSSRFAMHMGANVDEAFTPAARRNKTQTNIFAYGFDGESGGHIGIGASVKGRIWSHRAALSLKDWMHWCDYIGTKLKDDSIDPAEVMAGFIVPETLDNRPALVALALEWPSEAFLNTSEEVQVQIDGSRCSLIDAELTITGFENQGAIPFNVETPDGKIATYELTMGGGEMHFRATGLAAQLVTSRGSMPFGEYLKKQGLRIILEQQAIIEPSMMLVKPNEQAQPYDTTKLKVIDWTGIDLHKESQGNARDATAIQSRAAQHIDALTDWDVIIDDDGSGEMADIVAIKVSGNKLIVNLVHCKFSHGDTPGARVIDLYEVCGQAQKSIMRRHKPEQLIRNLIRREKHRRQSQRNGVMKGTEVDLQNIADKAMLLIPEFTITIVQPGVSKGVISQQQLELLAATESYIADTGGGTPLEVIVSG